MVKGTTNGVITDIDGNFHLEVTDKKVTLMVSYIGYASQEVVATPGKPMSIILKVDNNLLDGSNCNGIWYFQEIGLCRFCQYRKDRCCERCA